MTRDEMVYDILSECWTDEPLFVLVQGIDWNSRQELKLFLSVLIELINNGILESGISKYSVWHPRNQENNPLTFDELWSHVNQRIENGEELEKCPSIGKGYNFKLTDEGLHLLKKLEEQDDSL